MTAATLLSGFDRTRRKRPVKLGLPRTSSVRGDIEKLARRFGRVGAYVFLELYVVDLPHLELVGLTLHVLRESLAVDHGVCGASSGTDAHERFPEIFEALFRYAKTLEDEAAQERAPFARQFGAHRSLFFRDGEMVNHEKASQIFARVDIGQSFEHACRAVGVDPSEVQSPEEERFTLLAEAERSSQQQHCEFLARLQRELKQQLDALRQANPMVRSSAETAEDAKYREVETALREVQAELEHARRAAGIDPQDVQEPSSNESGDPMKASTKQKYETAFAAVKAAKEKFDATPKPHNVGADLTKYAQHLEAQAEYFRAEAALAIAELAYRPDLLSEEIAAGDELAMKLAPNVIEETLQKLVDEEVALKARAAELHTEIVTKCTEIQASHRALSERRAKAKLPQPGPLAVAGPNPHLESGYGPPAAARILAALKEKPKPLREHFAKNAANVEDEAEEIRAKLEQRRLDEEKENKRIAAYEERQRQDEADRAKREAKEHADRQAKYEAEQKKKSDLAAANRRRETGGA